MKKKKDCIECGAPLKDWQVRQDYDLCLECYNEKRGKKDKSVHEALKEEGQQEIKDEKKRKELEKIQEEEELADQRLGDSGHLEDDLQGEEED